MPASNIIWRIDDRLIHGQIIIGWCSQLPIRLLVVCDDEIAETEWEKNLLLMATPPGLPSMVLTAEETAMQAKEWLTRDLIVLVIMKSPQYVQKLNSLGLDMQKINIGGIHYRENRKEYLPYLYLSQDEVEIFRQLMETGIQVECQDLPNSPAYNLRKLIERKQ